MDIKFVAFFIILLIPISSAVEFSLISPKEINLDEEFSVTIDFQSEEAYDLKIYVHDDVQAYSEIYNGNEWKSTHYYLLRVLPAQKEFKLISHYAGETKICAKIRKPNSTPSPEKCNNIKVIQSESRQETEGEKEMHEEPENIPEETPQEQPKQSLPPPTQKEEEKPFEQERIILNAPAPPVTEEAPKIYRTKQEKMRLGIIYGFSIFTVIIIILLALKKL